MMDLLEELRRAGANYVVPGKSKRALCAEAAAEIEWLRSASPELTLTGAQALNLAEFVAGDCLQRVNLDSEIEAARAVYQSELESEVTIAMLPARTSSDGVEMHAGLYAWMTEYPEEGCVPLDEEAQDVRGAEQDAKT